MPKKPQKKTSKITPVKTPQSKKTRAQLLKAVGKGKDANGVYVKTHRARSKSYPSIEKIPLSVLKFIESTG